MNGGLYSSRTPEWATPQKVFDKLAAEYGPFDLDPCATPENAKCPVFYTCHDNGLMLPWFGRVFMNPPYGRVIGQWMRKAYEESVRGVFVVCLIPARTDTIWWHEYAMKGKVEFLRGRIRFEPGNNPAPFPSAVVLLSGVL